MAIIINVIPTTDFCDDSPCMGRSIVPRMVLGRVPYASSNRMEMSIIRIQTVSESLTCWRCGCSAAEHPMPMSTYAECSSCKAQLHVCRMCKHWNPKHRIGCDETRAEEVSTRETANFCQWFLPSLRAFQSIKKDQEVKSARGQLDELFDKGSVITNTSRIEQRARQELDDLFDETTDEIDKGHPPE